MPNIKLTDKLLIENLLGCVSRHCEGCEFLSVGPVLADIKKLGKLAERGPEADCLSQLQRDSVQMLWKNAITAAINVLKWMDIRENEKGTSFQYKDWLKQTFGNVAFGIDELESYFNEFVEFEQLLYGAERHYRDHFLHVIRVWLIGLLVITRNDLLPARLLDLDQPDIPSDCPCFQVTSAERLAMWTVTALCHDLGYPLEKIGGINVPLRKMVAAVGKAQVDDFAYEFPRQHQFIDNFIMQFISSRLIPTPLEYDSSLPPVLSEIRKQRCLFKTEIQPKFYLKLSKSFEELRHGILSCTLMMKRLVFLLESDFDVSDLKRLKIEDARQFLIRRQILRAIATHTCPDIYHLKCETYSFLLIVCDDLQEWNRPTFRELRGQPDRAPEVVLNAYDSKNVDCQLVFTVPKNEDFATFVNSLEREVRRNSRRLHKILRSAVDVQKRSFDFRWSVLLKQDDATQVEITFSQDRDNVSQFKIGNRDVSDRLYYDETIAYRLWEHYSKTGDWDLVLRKTG